MLISSLKFLLFMHDEADSALIAAQKICHCMCHLSIFESLLIRQNVNELSISILSPNLTWFTDCIVTIIVLKSALATFHCSFKSHLYHLSNYSDWCNYINDHFVYLYSFWNPRLLCWFKPYLIDLCHHEPTALHNQFYMMPINVFILNSFQTFLYLEFGFLFIYLFIFLVPKCS